MTPEELEEIRVECEKPQSRQDWRWMAGRLPACLAYIRELERQLKMEGVL